MEFTTQCFIHKNTANIRNRLKELGYYCNKTKKILTDDIYETGIVD